MMMKSAVVVALVLTLSTAWLWSQRAGAPAPKPAPLPSFAVAEDGTAVPYRGLSIQVNSGWYRPLETYVPLLDEIRGMGGNTVLFALPAQMEHAVGQAIFIDVRKVPPPDDLLALIRAANTRGLKVFLMPVVLLKNPRGNEWRGQIDPPDWDEWWEQYTDVVLHFANIAREGEAEGLIIGSELISTEKYTERWRKLIARVRTNFAGGKLGYSANWDHYRPVKFWDALDFVGMNSYYQLADEPGASLESLVARWAPIKAELLAWQREVGKPILMTEVGWCSQEGAAVEPWNYYNDQRATAAGLEEQRRLYEAFIRTWDGTPALMGAIWWEWDRGSGGPRDYGYTPRGKPAEQVLRRWLQAGPQPDTAAATQPAKP